MGESAEVRGIFAEVLPYSVGTTRWIMPCLGGRLIGVLHNGRIGVIAHGTLRHGNCTGTGLFCAVGQGCGITSLRREAMRHGGEW